MHKSNKGPTKSTGVPKLKLVSDKIEVPSTLDYLPRVDEFIEGKLKKLGIENGQIYDIAISVSELVTNAVIHGHKKDPGKKVRISLKADSSRVEVTVEDQGGGFDREGVCSPIEQANLLKEAGRGLHIVESLMDEVNVRCGLQGGTSVRIVKLIT
jgi:serine/threonine-protein kinase RsbW